jgi:hypothetical protein
MSEIKAKCKQDLFPIWSKYKRSFWVGVEYYFIKELRNNEIVYICNKNSLRTPAILSQSLFNSSFEIQEP